jgi:hypothetical protein
MADGTEEPGSDSLKPPEWAADTLVQANPVFRWRVPVHRKGRCFLKVAEPEVEIASLRSIALIGNGGRRAGQR